jgi:PEP-CTERM motif
MNVRLLGSCTAISLALVAYSSAQSIIFDDFNVDEGHFASSITGSGTTVGEDPASTIDRVTTLSLEGPASQQLHLIHDATATAYRVRHLSGGGAPANNVSFTLTAGDDGFIGFYLRTSATGWETSINLDGATGATGEMAGSLSLPIVADGEWHLYEWSLDLSNWGQIPGIGGVPNGSALALGAHTIDSIYFRDLDGTPGPTADIYVDFVAKSASGSIAALVPEPATLGLLALGASWLGIARRRRAGRD